MRTLLVGLLIVLGIFAAGVGLAVAREQLFRLTPVTNQEDAKACYAAGGKAALLFNLQADGNLGDPFAAACVTFVK